MTPACVAPVNRRPWVYLLRFSICWCLFFIFMVGFTWQLASLKARICLPETARQCVAQTPQSQAHVRVMLLMENTSRTSESSMYIACLTTWHVTHTVNSRCGWNFANCLSARSRAGHRRCYTWASALWTNGLHCRYNVAVWLPVVASAACSRNWMIRKGFEKDGWMVTTILAVCVDTRKMCSLTECT